MSHLKIFMGQPENIAINQVVGAKGRKIGNVTVDGDSDGQKSVSVVSSVMGISFPHYKIYMGQPEQVILEQQVEEKLE